MRGLQISVLRRSTTLKQTISDKTHVMFLLHLAKQRLNCNLLTPLLSSPSHRSPNNILGEVSWGQNIVIFHSIILLPTKWSEASGNQKKIFNLDGPVSSLTTCTLSLRRFKQRKEILWIVNLYKQIWERNGALRLKCPNQMTGIPYCRTTGLFYVLYRKQKCYSSSSSMFCWSSLTNQMLGVTSFLFIGVNSSRQEDEVRWGR